LLNTLGNYLQKFYISVIDLDIFYIFCIVFYNYIIGKSHESELLSTEVNPSHFPLYWDFSDGRVSTGYWDTLRYPITDSERRGLHEDA
jgi:hypothetical protein